MKNRLTFRERRGLSGSSPVVGQQSMSIVPCVTDPLMKLRGSWKNTPVRVCLCDTKDIEVVLGNEGTKAIILRMRRRFWKIAEILEAQAECVVQFQSAGGPVRRVALF